MALSLSIRPTRRRFLQGSAAAAMGAVGSPFAPGPLAAASDFSLTAGPARVPLVGGGYPETDVWAFDQQVPGPVIRAVQGTALAIDVTNQLPESTTVHWHGLRVPVGMDGVPYLSQPPIEPGQSFRYVFDLEDAGTYWYHPHINSAEQVGRGLHGALIIEEVDPPAVDRELLWVLDDWRLDQTAAITPFDDRHDQSHAGRIGNSATVNGRIPDVEPVRAGERIRLRLINAANARIFDLDFRGLDPWLIALDGQPVPPYRPGEGGLVLGPGMRADLILDMTGEPGSESQVVDAHYGPDRAYELIRFGYDGAVPLSETMGEPPAPLTPNPIAVPDLAKAERHHLLFEGGAMGGMAQAMMGGKMLDIRELVERGRLWAIDGRVPDDIYDEPPLLRAGMGSTQVIEMENRTAFEHPIHLHGHVFRVISRNGQKEPYQPYRDTVMMGVDETVEIAFVADNPGRWMFHCHVLEHQGAGMMGVVEVV